MVGARLFVSSFPHDNNICHPAPLVSVAAAKVPPGPSTAVCSPCRDRPSAPGHVWGTPVLPPPFLKFEVTFFPSRLSLQPLDGCSQCLRPCRFSPTNPTFPQPDLPSSSATSSCERRQSTNGPAERGDGVALCGAAALGPPGAAGVRASEEVARGGEVAVSRTSPDPWAELPQLLWFKNGFTWSEASPKAHGRESPHVRMRPMQVVSQGPWEAGPCPTPPNMNSLCDSFDACSPSTPTA